MFDVKQETRIKAESPLIGCADAQKGNDKAAGGGVTIYERPFVGQISLRGREDDAAFAAAAASVLGVDLPVAPNTFVEGNGIVACWLRPTEWRLLCPPDDRPSRLDALRAALGSIHSAVTDLSGGQTLIALAGEHAIDVLAKGTTLDVHPRALGAGRCTRTLLAQTTAFVRVIEPGAAFEIGVRRSFADHLWRWLRDAAGEYGAQVLAPRAGLPTTETANESQALAAGAL